MTRTKFQPGPAEDHYHETLGVGEDRTGVQTIRLLGPYVVNYNATDISGNSGHVITEASVPIGSSVVRAWVAMQSHWVGATNGALRVMIAPVSNPEDTWTLTEYHPISGSNTIFRQGSTAIDMEAVGPAQPVPSEWTARAALALEVSRIAVYASPTLTAGQVHVYVLIATPS